MENHPLKRVSCSELHSADLMKSCFLVCLCCCSALVITMVVSLLFILLLRYTADVLFWLLIFGVIAAIGYGESAA